MKRCAALSFLVLALVPLVASAAEDVRSEAAALLLRGFSEVERNPASARASFESAAAKFAESEDFFSAWMSRFYLAAMETRDGHWDAAIKQFDMALATLRDAESSDAKFSFEGVAAIAPMFEQAMPGAGGGLPFADSPMMKPLMLRMTEMLTRDQLGSCLVQSGKLEKAEAELTRAKDLSGMFFGVFDGPIEQHIGDLRRRQWRFDDARASYRKALEGVGAMPLPTIVNEPVELKILGSLAEIELLSGRVADALAWNDRALALIRKSARLKDGEHSVLHERATLLMQAGQYSEALQVLDGALQIAGENTARRAFTHTAIGGIQMFRGNYGAAVAVLEKAIALYKAQETPDPIGEGYAWTMLMQTYLALGAYDSAANALETVREIAKKSPDTPTAKLVGALDASLQVLSGRGAPGTLAAAFAELGKLSEMPEGLTPEVLKLVNELAVVSANPSLAGSVTADPNIRGASAFPVAAEMVYLIQGHEHFRAGRIQAARDVWTKALERSTSADMRGGYLVGIGVTHWKEGNRDEATSWFKRAADLVDENVGGIADDELLARFLGNARGHYFDITIGMLAQSGNAEEAFAYAERARARAFLKMIGNHRVAPRRGGDDSLVREAEALRLRIAASPFDSAAKDRYRALMRRVKTSNPEYASLTRVEPLSVATIRAELPADVTLVSYFLTNGGAHAWVLDQQSFEHVLLPVSDDALRRLVCWSKSFRARDARGAELRGRPCESPATAAEAYDLLFAPLREKIRHQRLFLIPHRVLHQIPFCALYDAKRGRYLIDDYTIQFVPSASALRFLRDKESPLGGDALVIGNPTGASLEGAQREAFAIARGLGTQPVLGAEAKESLLYQLDGSTDIVHIGAHGTFEPANPLFSRIALAPGDGKDGNLEVDEILSDVDLRGVNLVVLSACRTAIGERTGGDDVVSLTRAILYAGSPGVISTLWDISDEAAAILMEEFYCRLLGGDTAADALREAQRLLRYSARYGDPLYWGAFMLTGDPTARFHRSR